MTILAVADLHLTDKADDEYRFAFLEKALPREMERVGATVLLILGDLTEAKDLHSGALVNRIMNALRKLSTRCPIVILMGNHDYANEGEPFFAFSRFMRDVHFISKVAEGRKMAYLPALKECLFLPHSRNPERDWEGLDFTSYNYVFAHQTFQDADAGFGRRLDGYSTERFNGVRVYAGDIHKPQQVGPVTYIGAPYTIDFGDDYDAEALVIDEGRERVKEYFLRLRDLPQKKLIHIAEHQSDLRSAAFAKTNPGDLCRVRVEVDNMNDWAAILKHIQKQAKDMDLKIERVEPVLLNKTKRHSVKPVSGASKASDSELVRQFADRNKLSDGVVDAGLDIVEGK